MIAIARPLLGLLRETPQLALPRYPFASTNSRELAQLALVRYPLRAVFSCPKTGKTANLAIRERFVRSCRGSDGTRHRGPLFSSRVTVSTA